MLSRNSCRLGRGLPISVCISLSSTTVLQHCTVHSTHRDEQGVVVLRYLHNCDTEVQALVILDPVGRVHELQQGSWQD
jgi:hypothetical protein